MVQVKQWLHRKCSHWSIRNSELAWFLIDQISEHELWLTPPPSTLGFFFFCTDRTDLSSSRVRSSWGHSCKCPSLPGKLRDLSTGPCRMPVDSHTQNLPNPQSSGTHRAHTHHDLSMWGPGSPLCKKEINSDLSQKKASPAKIYTHLSVEQEHVKKKEKKGGRVNFSHIWQINMNICFRKNALGRFFQAFSLGTSWIRISTYSQQLFFVSGQVRDFKTQIMKPPPPPFFMPQGGVDLSLFLSLCNEISSHCQVKRLQPIHAGINWKAALDMPLLLLTTEPKKKKLDGMQTRYLLNGSNLVN